MRRWISKLLVASLVAAGIYGGVLYGQVHSGPVAAAAPDQPVGASTVGPNGPGAVGGAAGTGMMGGGSGYAGATGFQSGSGMMGSGGAGGFMGGAAGATTTGSVYGGMGGGMMGGATSGDAMGRMMGSAMAGYAPQRVSPVQAAALGNAAPNGATVDSAKNQITFTTKNVQFTVLASPDGAPDMTFRIAGLTDPTLVVPQGAQVSVQLIQADSGESHGWLLTAAQPPFPYMAMMDARAAFPGSFAMPLGAPTSAAMAAETITFTAGTPGQYTYLCPVPGHAQRGMHGSFIVTGA